MDELITALIELSTMSETQIITVEDYETRINLLCEKYGVDAVAETILRLGLV